MIVIRNAGPNELAAIRELLVEYSRWLEDPQWLGTDLGFGDFGGELEALPGPYAGPRGCLLLAEVDGVAAGCVALRPLGEDTCEMKRLYVRPTYRGRGLGYRLVRELLDAARRIGYRLMRLDTLPVMEEAQSLYRSLGFRTAQPYYADPLEGTVFMERDLTQDSPEGTSGHPNRRVPKHRGR